MPKPMIISIVFSVTAIVFAFWFISFNPPAGGDGVGGAPLPTAIIADGKQIIDITAKGGYSPRAVTAKAGMPTVLRIRTSNTFDCSSSVVIPKLSYQKFLEPSGSEDIELSAEQAQGTLQGLCAMGMYNFQIKFQ